MPDQSIKVCVIALTQTDYADIEPDGFRKLLDTPPPYYDFKVAGKPYAPAPDDWRPFGGDATMTQLLQAANLAPISTSIQLYDPNPGNSREARDKTDLYIIDPLVLMHRVKRDVLCYKVQEGIRTAKTAFCIILPSDIPPSVRAELEKACSTHLNDLFDTWLDVDVWEWEVEKPRQLQKFLRRVARQISEGANPITRESLRVLFRELGVPEVPLNSTPRMTSQ